MIAKVTRITYYQYEKSLKHLNDSDSLLLTKAELQYILGAIEVSWNKFELTETV